MNPLNLLEDPLRGLLNFLHDSGHLSYGWSIIVLTLIVRTILLPLVIKQYSSMRSMQMVGPQLKELQRKYKGNRQKLNEELMQFYKDHEINPFASCLPLVAQIPVFISLYYVLKSFARTATGSDLSFMWLIPDVRTQLDDIGWGAFILVAIYALSQLLSTELSATPNMPESQRRLMRILPVGVVFFVFSFPVPSGLVVYWMTTNLWTCGQQLVMRHRIGLHLADPEEIAKFNKTMEKKGQAPVTPESLAAAAADEPETGLDRVLRGFRGRGGTAAAEAEPAIAQAEEAPVPEEAPEPESAPEPEPEPESATVEPAPSPTPPRGGGGQGARRRQPRPKGTATGSRPAPRSRSGSKKKKKR